jgi:two-component system, LytTR family, sensor histidine kinase LytS
VALSDEVNFLAYKGAEKSHHRPGSPSTHAATAKVLTTGRISTPQTKAEIGCTYAACRLGSAIIVPLIKQEKTIGTLQLFRLKEHAITDLDRELANGLAHLFSNQLEISALSEQRKLIREAEIKALQAQINPHFLFNAINTIISTLRTDKDKAAGLLVRLADFFRTNIKPGTDTVSLATELEHCQAYIAIESARFEERIYPVMTIDESILQACRLPPLTLQPLIENALKHGILPLERGGTVTICAQRQKDGVRIEVSDDGVGMTKEKVSSLLQNDTATTTTGGAGIALKNVNARLLAIFGKGLQIASSPGGGTSVFFTVPLP